MRVPVLSEQASAAQIIVNSCECPKKFLRDQPCTAHFETVSTLADVAVNAVLEPWGTEETECEVHTKNLFKL